MQDDVCRVVIFILFVCLYLELYSWHRICWIGVSLQEKTHTLKSWYSLMTSELHLLRNNKLITQVHLQESGVLAVCPEHNFS